MLAVLLVLSVVALAWANGANDNFKGVASLYGSGVLGFRRALAVATAATLLGSALALVLARGLVESFSGHGLVPDELLGDPAFLVAVAGAGAATILLATRLGLPTSTTHALFGALLGISATYAAAPAGGRVVWGSFLQPLLLSPLLAVVGASGLYAVLARARRRSGVGPDTCVCVGTAAPRVVGAVAGGGAQRLPFAAPAAPAATAMALRLGEVEECAASSLVGVRARTVLDWLHGISGASVCFARAVNDTPKIAALGLAMAPGAVWPLACVAVAMAFGGVVSARRVAETMAKRITALNPGQGCTSNLVTAAIVVAASRFGLPVSTTHVSCGAIMGVGLVTRQANARVIGRVVAAWITTLPLGALLGSALFAALR